MYFRHEDTFSDDAISHFVMFLAGHARDQQRSGLSLRGDAIYKQLENKVSWFHTLPFGNMLSQLRRNYIHGQLDIPLHPGNEGIRKTKNTYRKQLEYIRNPR